MGSVKHVMLAGAAMIVAIPAAGAADLPPIIQKAPPLVEEFGGGWYLRGDIGISNQNLGSITFIAPNGTTPVQQNLSKGFDSAGIFGIGVGYEFNSWLRTDVTGEYRAGAHYQGLNLVGGTLPENDFATKSEWLILANAYADFGTWWGFTPFVGAGIGAAYNVISNFEDITGVVDAHNFSGATGTWNLAWALHAGVAYRVTPTFTVELAYRYLDLGNAKTGALTGYDGTPQGSDQFNHITSQDVKLGLRWMFAPEPMLQPYLPPLVRKG